MPIITIKVTGKPVTDDQKATLIRESTEMMTRVLNKPAEITWVLIEEVPMDNWGVGGVSAARVLEDGKRHKS